MKTVFEATGEKRLSHLFAVKNSSQFFLTVRPTVGDEILSVIEVWRASEPDAFLACYQPDLGSMSKLPTENCLRTFIDAPTDRVEVPNLELTSDLESVNTSRDSEGLTVVAELTKRAKWNRERGA